MRIRLICLLLLASFCVQAQDHYQLAPPLISYSSAFFKDSMAVQIRFNQPGAEVWYTLNGKEPDKKSLRYKNPVIIRQPGILKVKSIGKGFTASETISIGFEKMGLPVKEISYSRPNEYYTSLPENVLFDGVGGNSNFRSGNWLGYDSDTVTIRVALEKPSRVSDVSLNLLQDENSWIFLPEQILAYYQDTASGKFLPFAKETFQHEGPATRACSLRHLEARTPVVTGELLLEIQVLKKMPDWHASKGSHAWLFIDEIIVR